MVSRNGNPNVVPARTSSTERPFVRACRTPMSKDKSSRTCQIIPTRSGYSSELAELLLVEEFGDGADLPIVGTFNDHAGKGVGMLVSGQGDGTVEMNGAPIPALRGNSGEARTDAFVGIDPWKKDAELRGDAEPGLVLQATFTKDVFEEHARIGDFVRAGRR